jgi:rsbT co-antagonist protein RsbR
VTRVNTTGDETTPAAPRLESDLLENINQLLDVLVRVGAGESVGSLPSKYPDSHPVGALTMSLNEIIGSLAEARRRSEDYSRDLQSKIAAIQAQEAAIAELSTPILEVWHKVLCMPIVGIVDGSRTEDMARTLLSTIVETKATVAVIDITGIQTMDTRAVDHFLRMARAIRLLGARCILSGVHPNISQTIVHMGMDLKGIETHRSLRDALGQFVVVARAARPRARAKAEMAAEASDEIRSTPAELTPPATV